MLHIHCVPDTSAAMEQSFSAAAGNLLGLIVPCRQVTSWKIGVMDERNITKIC